MTVQSDLHTHTTASDGEYSPAALVAKAVAAGVECLAVTDHDTTGGLEEAVRAGEKLGLRVLRGIELGAREEKNLHILGYNLRPGAPGLEALCRKMRESRDERKYRILDFLREKGVPLSLEEVEGLAGGEVIARPHFARAMVARGYVSTTREAFDRYLDTGEYQRIERFKESAAGCIGAIRAAGGRAVLAHPYQIHYPDDKLERLVARLKEAGLEGLECHYPRHTPAMVRFYLDLAARYGLHVSAGSDFHGERVRPDTPLTPVPLDLHWLLGE